MNPNAWAVSAMMRAFKRPFDLRYTGLAAFVTGAIVGMSGCASDLHARQSVTPAALEAAATSGDVGSAFDRFFAPTLAAPAYGVTPSLHLPAGPPPASPPPLPVVRMDPSSNLPFANGQEPPIRMGRKGPKAPPVSQLNQGPLSYSRIDSRGNLLDAQGQVLYRAGLNRRAVDTHPPEEHAKVIYDSTHASPRQLVARSTRVPRIAGLNDAQAPGAQQAPGYVPPTGVQPLEQPRLKQFQIRNYDLPDERDYNVRVDTYAAQAAPVGQQEVAGSSAGAKSYVPPANALEAQRYDAMPQAYDSEAPTYQAPEPAPQALPAEVVSEAPATLESIKQVTFKGAKERRVQRLYKRAMKDLKKNNYKLATNVFKKLLKRYPTHDLADNALYWMGEGAYARGDWLQAMTWFQDVILRYPEGNKLPDAMLKSALCYAKLGDTSYAVQMLTEVETLFSGLPVAEVARKRRSTLSGGM